MRQFVIKGTFGIENLKSEEVAIPQMGDDEVLVKMGAASLNYVDLVIIEGILDSSIALPFIPIADGAGIVVDVGCKVQEFKKDSVVASVYIAPWQDGKYQDSFRNLSIRPGAGKVSGQLTEYKVFKANELILIPNYLTVEEASSLPIAAVTAWNALKYGNASPGKTVLIHGTGGVSIFALQFAKIFGLKTIITSSSDAKLEKAKKLGADHVINYKKTPDLSKEVIRYFPNGVDLVIETVGGKNMQESLKALKTQGYISVVGFLDGVNTNLDLIQVNLKLATIKGVSVGSKEDFKEMLVMMDNHKVKPVIDQVFELSQTKEALMKLKVSSHFGKVVVKI